MKDYFNLRKSKLLLFVLLAVLAGGVSPAWAETLTETFDEVTVTSRYLLSNGWVMVHSNGSYQGFGGSYDYQIKSGNYDGETGNSLYCNYSDDNEYVVIPTKLSGTFTYYVKYSGSSNGTVTFFEAQKDGDTFSVTATQLATTSTGSSWVSKSFDLGEDGKYVAICLLKSRIDQISATVYEEITGPVLKVFDGSTQLTSGYSYNFGLATAGTTHEFTLSNPGTENLDVSVSEKGNFGATLSSSTISAGGEVTLTVTMPNETGNSTITITPASGSGIDPFEINVSGTIRDANKYYVNDFSTSYPEGWKSTGTWSYSETNGAYTTSWSLSNNSRLITPLLSIEEGETFFVDAKGYSTSNTSYQHLQMQYSADGSTWINFDAEPTLDPSEFKVFSFTGAPIGKYYIAINASQADIRMFYGGTLAPPAPVLEFTETDYDFGLVANGKKSPSFTIKNTGTASLEELVVSSKSSDFIVAVTGGATSIATNGSATFTVEILSSTPGFKTGTISISGKDVSEKTFEVIGYVADDSKIFTTFTSKPDRWTNNGWELNANGATAGYNGEATLTSPKINASTQKLAISAKLQGESSSYYVKVKGYDTLDKDWTYETTLSLTTNFTVVELTDIPATVNRICIVGKYAIVNGFNGFTYDENDPELSVYDNNNNLITTASNNWGFLSKVESATYTIKNTGVGTLNLNAAASTGFTVDLNPASIAANETATLTVTMANDPETNEGYHSGDVVLTATDVNNTKVGTFTVTSTGVVVGSKTDVNFETLDDYPDAGWVGTNWTVTSGVARTNSYNGGTLTTGSYSIANGDVLVIKAKGNNSYSAPTLKYQYTTDGKTWQPSIAKDISSNFNNSDYSIYAISDIPEADKVKIKFVGSYVDICRIYGFNVVAEPIMELSPETELVFPGILANEEVKTITVTNTGNAPMTGLTATLDKGDDSDYAVKSISSTTIAAGGTVTITVTQKYDASKGLYEPSDVMTITADGMPNKTINLSGRTRDNSKWFVDFAGLSDSKAVPKDLGFVQVSSWIVQSEAASNINTLNETSLITQPINFSANEKLYFEAKKSPVSPDVSPSLKIRYSIDNGFTWSEYADYSSAISSNSSYSSHEIDFNSTDAVTAIIEFSGMAGVYIDNIYGGILNSDAPILKVTEYSESGEDVVINSGSIIDLGSIDLGSNDIVDEYSSCSYTITNIGKGTLEISNVISSEGVMFYLDKDGNTLMSGEEGSITLESGDQASLMISIPWKLPYGEKSHDISIKTNIGDFAINYKAYLRNPNALDEKFENSKPAGWFFEGYWTVSNEEAKQDQTATAGDLITPKLKVTGPNDVLTFKVAKTSSHSTSKFTVYYSTDRFIDPDSWTKVDLSDLTLTTTYQEVKVKGLEAGNYYLKIEGARVKVDDFYGWEKIDVDHDLYITATSFPTDVLIPNTENGVSATITAYSLIAEETGVYAKLFFDDLEVATSETQDISLNASKTFTLTGKVPEAEGTYTAKIVLYTSNGETFESQTAEVTVAHTRSLEIVSVEQIGETTVKADENNQFVPNVKVTVKNTGTVALDKNEYHVQLVKNSGSDVGTVYTTIWNEDELPVGDQASITFTEPISAGEGGEQIYRVMAGISMNYVASDNVTFNITASAPKFALYRNDTPMNDGDDVKFGLVKTEIPTYTFTIKNEGTKALELVSIDIPEGFEVTTLTDGNKIIEVNGTLDIDVTIKPEQGKKSGELKFTYKVDANTNNTFSLNLDGNSISEYTWVEDFNEAIAFPTYWDSNTTWTVSTYSSYENNTKMALAPSDASAGELVTPCLAAKAGEVLTWDAYFNWYDEALKVEYSNDDKATWVEIYNYKAQVDFNSTRYTHKEMSFTAPADGYYYLRFTSTYSNGIDNLVGFSLVKESIALDESSSDAFEAATYREVTLNRTYATSGWNTIVLPFSVDDLSVFGEGAKAFEFTGYENGDLKLSKVNSMSKATPYLLYVPTAISEPIVFNNTAIVSSTVDVTYNGASFKGTYTPIAAPGMQGKYGVTTEAKIAKGSEKASIKGFRAYFELPNGADARLVFLDETTGITTVMCADEWQSNGIYNLNGQPVKKVSKGLYIKNGKKVVVK